MKLLSLNTHSLEEDQMALKQQQFVEQLVKLDPDIVALQEVNQRIDALPIKQKPSSIQVLSDHIPLRSDNHIVALDESIKKAGLSYSIVWLPIKIGYGIYDEGLAFLSKKPIRSAYSILLSQKDDYEDFRTRKALCITTDEGTFVNVHMGWWNDLFEPFQKQWNKLITSLSHAHPLFVMGDFNAEASVRNEGYDQVVSSGLIDLYSIAQYKDSGITVNHVIDGWRDQGEISGMRIDYIFAGQNANVSLFRSAFSGKEEPVISDHFGLYSILSD